MSEEQSLVTSAQTEGDVNQATAQAPEPSPAADVQIPEKFGGDINKLVESYNHLESKLGSMYSLPSEDSSPERWQEFDQRVTSTGRYIKTPNLDNPEEADAFFNSLGRPEKPDGYEFQIDDSIQPYVDKNLVNQYSELAHKVGLSKQQAQALVDFEVQRGLQQLHQLDAGREQSEQVLRQHWGPDYDNRMAGAKAAAAAYSEKYPDAVQQLINGPEGNNPALIAMLSELGGSLRESSHAGNTSAPQYGMSSAEAHDKIREIMDNRSHPYYDASHPGHSEAVQKVKKLYSVAYPDG